jgi:predicted nucleic acid-binding protein
VKVIDASVAIKWVRREEEFSREAINIQRQHLDKINKIIVPKLIFYEVGNALATKSDTSLTSVKKGMEILFESKLEIYNDSKKELLLAAKLAKKHRTSVYDMLYAVIAKEHNTILYTADKNFIKKTKFKYVKHISEVKLEN